VLDWIVELLNRSFETVSDQIHSNEWCRFIRERFRDVLSDNQGSWWQGGLTRKFRTNCPGTIVQWSLH